MKLFQVIELEPKKWWAVFAVNPKDANDRFLVTSSFDKKNFAEHYCMELNRIADVKTDEDIREHEEWNGLS